MKNENNINIKRFKRQNKNKQTNAKIYQERGTQEGNRECVMELRSRVFNGIVLHALLSFLFCIWTVR